MIRTPGPTSEGRTIGGRSGGVRNGAFPRLGDRGVTVKARARRIHCSSAELSQGISIGGASTEISFLRQVREKRDGWRQGEIRADSS